MYFTSKRTSLLILAITSLACSRILFLFFNDPEGPNLLVVTGVAVIVYFVSLGASLLIPSAVDFKRISLAIFVQIIATLGLYFCLN